MLKLMKTLEKLLLAKETITQLVIYSYFKENYKMIAIDLRKQQALFANPGAIQQINFTGNLDRAGSTMLFILEEAKETILDFQAIIKYDT